MRKIEVTTAFKRDFKREAKGRHRAVSMTGEVGAKDAQVFDATGETVASGNGLDRVSIDAAPRRVRMKSLPFIEQNALCTLE